MWYKLAEKTIYGAIISFIGVIITISVNFIFIPKFGYVASAYATLLCYGSMMVIGYLLGQLFYPIPYKLWKIFIYMICGAVLYYVSIDFKIEDGHNLYNYAYHTLLIILYLSVVFILEKPIFNKLNLKR